MTAPDQARQRPVVGVLCCNEEAGRPVQVVASRFVAPLSTLAGATVLLVPAISEVADVAAVAQVLDGLLLTGSRSHVAPQCYGGAAGSSHGLDHQRDAVALALADRMIAAGKPVYGICRGLQEINVLFGGTLSSERCAGRHHAGSWDVDYASLFDHRHEVVLTDGGALSMATGTRRLTVNSVHEQGVDRLGGGLAVEALASDDGLIEAFSAPACGADVLAVQWHPEWDFGRSSGSRAFFALIGDSLGRSVAARRGWDIPPPSAQPTAAALRGH